MDDNSEYIYDVDDKAFLQDLINYLELKNTQKHIFFAECLKFGKCHVIDTHQFSNKWDVNYAKLKIMLPSEKIRAIRNRYSERSFEKTILYAIPEFLDSRIGFDFNRVELKLLTSHSLDNQSLSEVQRKTSISDLINSSSLPLDLLSKGEKMSDAYQFLFLIENALRLFIEEVAKKEFGDSFLSKLSINNNIRKSIKARKEDEMKNRWIPPRGTSDIFYVDFKDLGNIIQSNWDLFKEVLPEQSFITSRISEFSKFRNIIAHSNFIPEEEFDTLITFYRQIINQIKNVFTTI